MGEIVVGLDVGTHKICTIVGEVRDDSIFVLGVGIEPSRGMKKGVVNDIQELTRAISASVHKAERSSGYDIERAFVSIAGDHIHSLTSRGMIGIPAQRGVQASDLEKVMENARSIAIPHNREILHIVPRSYTLDGQDGIRRPIGMHCFRLEVDAHIITAATSSIANLEQAIQAAGLTVDRFILNPLAAGDVVLSPQEREMGVVVIDIGGGTTDLAIFIDDTIWHTAVLAVGGNHLTQDITYWLHVPFELAEAIKIQHGHAYSKRVNMYETFMVEPFGEGMPTEVSRYELAEVLEARVEEMFQMVQREMKRSGYDGLLRAGAVITGGSSQIPGLVEVATDVLRCPVRLAQPENLTGMADSLRSPSYSTSVGLLSLGLDIDSVAEAQPEDGIGFPKLKLAESISNFLKRFIPDDREQQ